MERKETKKELILDAASELFASKGFEATSIDEIGEAAGFKGPAIYYYFKGKDAIIEALIEQMEMYYVAQFGSSNNIQRYPETFEELGRITLARINETIRNPKLRKGRRIIALGQFKDERLARLATEHNITGMTKLNTLFFTKLIEAGKIVDDYDPEFLAFEFVTPITAMILVADRQPENIDIAIKTIEKHIDHFGKVYCKK